MHSCPFLFISLLLFTVWNCLFVNSRPQGWLFLDGEQDGSSGHNDDSKFPQLDFNSDIFSALSNFDGDNEPDPGLLISTSNDFFPPVKDSFSPDLSALVQTPFSCETIGNIPINDEITDISQLQARKDKPSSCLTSTIPLNESPPAEIPKSGNVNDDDLFKDSSALVQNPSSCQAIENSQINDETTDVAQLQARKDKPSCPSSAKPSNESPSGQMTKPGHNNDDDDLNFKSFFDQLSIPDLFQEDEEICPSRTFGLSNIPVCDNLLFSPVVVLPGQDWVTLYDVYTYHHNVVPCFELSSLWCCREVVAQKADSAMHGNVEDFDLSRLNDDYKKYFTNFLTTTYNAYYCYPQS